MRRKTDNILYIALFLICAVWLCIFLQMTPQSDDFSYIASPVGGRFTRARPVDVMVGVILRSFPFMFPWFNRALVITAHFISCVIFHKIAVNALRHREYAAAFALLFSISPWVYAGISQTDSINNVVGFAFGIVGAYLYFNSSNEIKANAFYLLFAALALGSKESNAAFLGIIPGMLMLKVIHGELDLKSAIKRIFRSYIWGGILAAVYVFIFFIKMGFSSPGPSSHKTFIADLIGKITFPFAAFTGVNTFDVFNGLWLNASIGLFLSVPLVMLAFINFIKMAKAKDKYALIAPMLFIFGEIFLLPSQLFAYMSDMHMYPYVFFALLIVMYYLPKDKKKLTRGFLALYFAAFLFSCGEKIYWQNISSGYVRDFQAGAYQEIGANPEKIHVIFPHSSIVDKGLQYGGYANDWFVAQSYGESLYMVYGYDAQIFTTAYYSLDEIDGLAEAATDGATVLVVYPDKSLMAIK